MLFKIALRNALRSIEKYFVFFCTMSIIAGLLFAFDAMIFSEDIKKICEEASLMGVVLLIATGAVILIAAWLIHYMMEFMLEKKSREFAVYMLLGIRYKKIGQIYFWENFALGLFALAAGFFIAIPMKSGLMKIFYNILKIEYEINTDIHLACFAFTVLCYCACFVFAMVHSQRKLRKTTIYKLINIDKENEKINERHSGIKKALLLLSILYIAGFYICLFLGKLSTLYLCLGIILFAAAIYGLYIGISGFIVDYIRKKKNGVYHKYNIFLMRQFVSKMKTMSFTMGTITIFFMVTLIGSSMAFLLNDFQNKELSTAFPFDVSIHHEGAHYAFDKEKEMIAQGAGIQDAHVYQIYENGTNQFSDCFYKNLSFFHGKYAEEEHIQSKEYYQYDLFISLSDYNYLRQMLNYDRVELDDSKFLLQTKERLKREVNASIQKETISLGGEKLSYGGCETIPFCQNGHNGADFLIVVPDKYIEGMQPYYSQMAVQTKEDVDDALWEALSELNTDKIEAVGTDIIMYSDTTLVKNLAIRDMKFVLTFLIFPLFYIGLVFLIVAVTVLAVQQLSDSNKYRFRYAVLQKIGASKKEVSNVIKLQLAFFYLVPAVISSIISFFWIGYIERALILYTGLNTMWFSYFGCCLGVFLIIYAFYFLITYIEFKHNILKKDIGSVY